MRYRLQFLCVVVAAAVHYVFTIAEEAGSEMDEVDVFYTPAADCISRLAVFIGDQKYVHDFLSDDRR